jgi:phenylalanyl-tRNA synthetase alpha subunit
MASKKPAPLIPVSWGELIDKITILEIKRVRLRGEAVLANVSRELKALSAIAAPVLAEDETARHLMARLKALNETLWNIEIGVRAKEAANRFDAEFVELARTIYKRNDERAALKRQLNLQLGSELIEEKNYKPSN